MENNNSTSSSFWQFSDNLRLQTSSLADLSLNDSIWSTNHTSKRRNFDFRNDNVSEQQAPPPTKYSSDLNINDAWKTDSWKLPSNDALNLNYSGFGSGLNGGFNKGVYNTPSLGLNNNSYGFDNVFDNKGKGLLNNVVVNGQMNYNIKSGRNNEEYHSLHGGKLGKKNKGNNDVVNKESGNNSNDNKAKVDKRLKTMPPAEALPRNETIGGYIFVCNNDTMTENLKRQLFGLPSRYRDSVRAITPGLPLFLYNYSTHQLHGIFEAASFGGTNIDPTAWEDKKKPGESRFPAQVRVVTRKICEPLEEDSFRPILHHYDGPKFRLELNVPEALSLLDILAEKNN